MTQTSESEIALAGQAVKLFLPGGALVLRVPAAVGLVVFREARTPQGLVPSTSVGIDYLDPGGGLLRGFEFATLQSFLMALEKGA